MGLKDDNHPSRARSQSGFTLLEVLIAFTILTVSATIMLQQLHAVMKYSERAQVKQAAISHSLNEANSFKTIVWNRVSPRLSEKQLSLDYTDEKGRIKNVIVQNHIYQDVDVPMTVAFAPFQIFDFGGQAPYSLRLLQPGLLPRVGDDSGVAGRF